MDEQMLKNEFTKEAIEDRIIVDSLLGIVKEIGWQKVFLLAHNLDRLNQLFLSIADGLVGEGPLKTL